jgi:hypothetical protein
MNGGSMGLVTHSPLRLPSLETLPEADATIDQIIRFVHSVDPTTHFQDRWGEEYRTNVQALWHRCVQSYKAGAAATGGVDELIMCLTYDVVLGPCLGVPEPHKLSFLRWVIDGVRQDLQRHAAPDKTA